jgi:FKBP-type peptidyl-prolyl cis-trans isomerase FkpA
MRLRFRLLGLVVLPLALAACNDSPAAPVGTPIDCKTLATSLETATGLTTTASGLRYRDQVVGTGTTVAFGNFVAVHYAGCLTNGTVFDQNLDVDPALVFQLGAGGIIEGFDEGVRGMRVGGTRQLVIPASLAYGASGYGPIPANATIVFTVMLVAAQ